MKIPQYITDEDVRKACQELNIRDWTTLAQSDVPSEEASTILAELEVETTGIDLEDFRIGLEVELEHGKHTPEANVTNNHPIVTGLIVLAHLRESLDYYKFLDVAEIEGDLAKAAAAGDAARVDRLYRRLITARLNLDSAISKQLA